VIKWQPTKTLVVVWVNCKKMSKPESKPVDPNQRYRNPSFGLYLWGPLVPASDCTQCLYGLSGVQFVAGLMLWRLPGRKSAPHRRLWVIRSIRTGGVLAGSYLMILASMELVRLAIPSDPWAEDAAEARKAAEKRGGKVSRWFGPTGYRSIDYREWKRRMDAGIARAEAVGHRVNAAKEVYSEIRQNNRSLSHKILLDLQKENMESDQTRENKALIELKHELGDSQRTENKDGGESIEWDALEPWEKLRDDTDIVVRLMPHSRGIHEEATLAIPLGANVEIIGEEEEPSGSESGALI
jgi:hypothetical protein